LHGEKETFYFKTVSKWSRTDIKKENVVSITV